MALPGVRSIYRWEGDVQTDDEVLLVLKTTDAGLARVRDRLVELHPYDVPELVALPVMGGHEPYLAWVRNEVGGEP